MTGTNSNLGWEVGIGLALGLLLVGLIVGCLRARDHKHWQRKISLREEYLRSLLDATTNGLEEQRISERIRQLETANRAKSDFLANMSHELRTPLNAIIGFSELFKDGALGPLNERQQIYSSDIYDAGKHLLSLINDILDLSKIEAGMLQLQRSPVDLRGIFQNSTLMVRANALANAIELRTHVDPRLSSCLTDERKVKQIIYNLLSNAIHFTPRGGIVTLRFDRCQRTEIGLHTENPYRMLALPAGDACEFLVISVQDTGIGIAQDNLHKLFEPFAQVDSSTSRLQSGSGLGLSLVRKLAEFLGGTVGVSSQWGVGSQFHVWLPYSEIARTTPPDEPARVGLAAMPN